MNAIDLALRMEMEREERYREVGSASLDRGVVGLAVLLESEEVAHGRRLAELREAIRSVAPPVPVPPDVAKDVIRRLEPPDGLSFETTEQGLLRQALAMVRDTRPPYRERVCAVAPLEARDACLRVADEEDRHAERIEDMVGFVGRPEPGHWLENAEWTHLDEY